MLGSNLGRGTGFYIMVYEPTPTACGVASGTILTPMRCSPLFMRRGREGEYYDRDDKWTDLKRLPSLLKTTRRNWALFILRVHTGKYIQGRVTSAYPLSLDMPGET